LNRARGKSNISRYRRPNRVDDEAYGNRDTKQVAELACEKEQAKILIPVKHPSQKAVAK